MIKNIEKIKNCPSFVDFKPEAGLPEFSRYTLIYGWNGSGKTSFSRILRSFELGENFFNNPEKPAEFEFKLSDNTSISLDNLSGFKQIRVFNKDFIDDTVFCESGPKSILFLGKESKEDKEKITKAEQELELLKKDKSTKEVLFRKAEEAKSKSLTSQAKEIKLALTTPRDDSYRNYEKPSLENAIKDNADQLIEPDKLKLSENRLAEIKKSIVQTSKTKIDVLDLPDFNIADLENKIKDVLTKTVISKVIESLKADEVISKWVEKGLAVHKEKSLGICAFCNQNVPPDRLKELENHFNDEYQKTLQSIQGLKDACDLRKVTTVFPESSELYDELSSKYISDKKKAETTLAEFNKTMDSLVFALKQKESNLFSEQFLQKIDSVDENPFDEINKIIKRHNKKTDNFESQIDTDKKDLESHYIADFITNYNEIVSECETSKNDFLTSSTALKTKEDEITTFKENLISHHIPAQQINKDLEHFLGRDDIQLRATDTKDGYQIMRNGEIAKNLSEGEKNSTCDCIFSYKNQRGGF